MLVRQIAGTHFRSRISEKQEGRYIHRWSAALSQLSFKTNNTLLICEGQHEQSRGLVCVLQTQK